MMTFGDVFLPQPGGATPEFWRGKVTAIDPIRVERAQGQLMVPPENFAGPLAVGDRVFGATINTRPVILGRSGPPRGVTLLDAVEMEGNTYDRPGILTIPSAWRGEFHKYVIDVGAGTEQVTANNTRVLTVRVNGDDGENYRSQATIHAYNGDVIASSNLEGTAFPRSGYIGEYVTNVLEITMLPSGLGDVGLMSWTTHGWANRGSTDGALIRAGGRWNGDTQEVGHFELRTNSSAAEWKPGSRATLWGYR